MAAFEELGLMEELCMALEDMEWYLPKPVQQDAIPQILGGGDIMCAAETGAGKTGAFCLPIIQITHEKLNAHIDPKKMKASLKHCKLNKTDCEGLHISEDGLQVNIKNIKSWGGARALFGVTKGKWAYHVSIAYGAGCKFGWATQDAKLDLGTDRGGFGFSNAGAKHANNQATPYGEKFQNDKITCLIDRDERTVSYLKNGKSLGVAFELPESLDKMPLFPCVSAQSATFELNFGLGEGLPPLPPGYLWVEEAKGPEQEKHYGEFVRKYMTVRKGLRRSPTCIIMEPTLELCQQIVDELHKFIKYIDNPKLRVCSIFGRRGIDQIVEELRSGVDIVVGTGTRIQQFMEMPDVFSLAETEFLVLDEADRLTDGENVGFVKKLYTEIRTQSRKRLQLCMFSATLHDPAIKELAEQLCPNAVWVDLKGKDFVPETVHHAIIYADPDDDDRWKRSTIQTDGVHEVEGQVDKDSNGPDPARRMCCRHSYNLKRLKPEILMRVIDAYKMEQCLIFCRTRDDCDHLSEYLNRRGGEGGFDGRREKGKENPYSNVAMHSGFDARTRRDHLDMFKEGEVRFLICTDVAARGLDIKQLPFVINMTLPDKAEDYIHRIGRTGRADRMGLAVSIATSKHREKVWYHSNCNRGKRGGRVCQDIRLVEEGGCCIWYNEPQMIVEIEKRCGEKLHELDEDYKYADKSADAQAAQYGKSREEAKMKKSDHVRAIEEHAEAMGHLAHETQSDYLKYAHIISQLESKPATSIVSRGAGRGVVRRPVPSDFPRSSSASHAAVPGAAAGVKTFSQPTRGQR
ncbi:ATP-dependent RNA helicase Ddx1 [Diplonema papillatum]|nr:ATP-dependent RNA helicase Ddx1 [Diplonema papillatum]